MSKRRIISWFSCGAASAVATKLTLERAPKDTQIVRCVLDNEHKDNTRFARDCEEWFGKKIIEIRSSKYKDCWDVWRKRRFLNSPAGALCTVELKKKVRQEFQRDSDIQVFGFTYEERERAKRFRENNLEVLARFPLIGLKYSKEDCFKILSDQVILLPAMYRLGYRNANCVGCVKGGMGYWNKIREDFPEVFKEMAELEREIGRSCIKGVFLDELDPKAGRHQSLELPECGLFCQSNA